MFDHLVLRVIAADRALVRRGLRRLKEGEQGIEIIDPRWAETEG